MSNAENRFNKVKRLVELGAPKWIRLHEGFQLLQELGVISKEEQERLIESHVIPAQDGNGYITVPDSE